MRDTEWIDRRAAAAAAVLVVVALALGLLAARFEVFPADTAMAAWVRGWRDTFEPVATFANDRAWFVAGPVLLVGIVIAFARGRRDLAAIFVVAMVLRPLLQIVKRLVDRPRPEGDFEALASFSGSSFPSGHVMTAVTVYGAWFLLAPALVPSRYVLAVRVAACAAVVLHAFARIWAGVHWPSDTVGAVIWAGVPLAVLLALRPAFARLLGGRAEDEASPRGG